MNYKLLSELNLEETEFIRNSGLETGFAKNSRFFTRNNII